MNPDKIVLICEVTDTDRLKDVLTMHSYSVTKHSSGVWTVAKMAAPPEAA